MDKIELALLPDTREADEKITDLCADWGWQDEIPDEVIHEASYAVYLRAYSQLDSAPSVYAELKRRGLLDDAKLEIATAEELRQRVVQTHPALVAVLDRIHVLMHFGLQYIADPELIGLHLHSYLQDQAERARMIPGYRHNLPAFCISKNAVLFERAGHDTPLLVFGDLLNLRAYQSLGRPDRDYLIERLGIKPRLALCEVKQQAHYRSMSHHIAVDAQADKSDKVWAVLSTRHLPSINRLADIIDSAVAHRATDLDIDPLPDNSGRIRIRIDQLLHDPQGVECILTEDELKFITNFISSRSGANPELSRIRAPLDGKISFKSGIHNTDIRCSFIPLDPGGSDQQRVSISLRFLNKQQVSHISLKNDCNVPDDVIAIIDSVLKCGQGQIILCGPTNSGKSTTIAGIHTAHFDLFGHTKKRISIEDPVERTLEYVKQIDIPDASLYGEYLRALLRHDPDVISIGEIRDSDSAGSAARAATSGHLVLTTVHANSAIEAYHTIANMLTPDKKRSYIESLELILAQRLIRRFCPHCQPKGDARWREVTSQEQDFIVNYAKHRNLTQLEIDLVPVKPPGCKKCLDSGYQGMLPIHEMLLFPRDLKDILHRPHYNESEIEPFRRRTLFHSAGELVKAGVCTIDALAI